MTQGGDSRTALRRRDRGVEDEAWIRETLRESATGVLATVNEGQPFLNSNLFAYDEAEHAIWMHTASTGRTRTNIDADERVAFTVFEMGRLLPADTALEFSVEYAGVVVFGRGRVVTEPAAARRALQLLLDKYFTDLAPGTDYQPITDDELLRTAVYRIDIEAWSGKRKRVAEDFEGARCRLPRRALAGGLALALAAGCADPAARGAGFSVTDSAGVEIVRNGADPADAPVPVAAALTIGEQEGPESLQFFRVADIAVAGDGALFVINAGSSSVRAFDAQGRFINEIGRSGQGPGEFQFPSWIEAFGDTVAVFDGRLFRLSLFGRDGTVLDTWPSGDFARGVLYPFARTPGGWLVQPFRLRGWQYQVGVARQDTFHVAAVSSLYTLRPDTLQPRVVVAFASPRAWGVQSPQVMTAARPLFEPEARPAADALGNVYLHAGAPYAIEVYDWDGRLRRRILRDVPPVPVSDDMVARHRDRVTAYWDTATHGPEWEIGKAADEAKPTLPHVEALPPLGRILVSAEGTVWVERIDLDPDPLAREWTRVPRQPVATVWDVFDPDGRFLRAVEMPPKFTPRVVGPDWVVGVQRDELDIERVVRYEPVR